MDKKLTIVTLMLFLATGVFAQNFGTPPVQPNEFGKCYAKCKIPARYDYQEREVLVSGGQRKTRTVPSKYETVSERVMVKEGSVKYTYVPATYESTSRQILVKEAGCKIKFTPAKYDFSTTKTLRTPESGKWIRKKKGDNCISENPDDCYILCWEMVPAVYSYNTTRSLMRSETYDTVYTDASYSTLTVKRIKSPARYETVQIPPVYKTINKKVLRQCSSVIEEITPSKYKTVREKITVEAGGYTDWIEVVCQTDMNSSLIRRVQSALNAQGYQCGTPDGVLGMRTRDALARYQRANNLPIGQLNIKTMESLGVR